MTGHIEPLTGVLRIGGPYGAYCPWVGTLRYLKPTEVEVVAVQRAPTSDEWRDACAVMKASGIDVFRLKRFDGNQVVEHAWTTSGKRIRTMNKKVSLSLDIKAVMTDADGTVMAEFGLPASYKDVPYADALDVQESFMQAIAEHGARMLAKGRVHASKK